MRSGSVNASGRRAGGRQEPASSAARAVPCESGPTRSRAAGPGRGPRRLTPMRQLTLTFLVGLLLTGALPGCATSPADQEATRKAWAARDAERAAECARNGCRLRRGRLPRERPVIEQHGRRGSGRRPGCGVEPSRPSRGATRPSRCRVREAASLAARARRGGLGVTERVEKLGGHGGSWRGSPKRRGLVWRIQVRGLFNARIRFHESHLRQWSGNRLGHRSDTRPPHVTARALGGTGPTGTTSPTGLRKHATLGGDLGTSVVARRVGRQRDRPRGRLPINHRKRHTRSRQGHRAVERGARRCAYRHQNR